MKFLVLISLFVAVGCSTPGSLMKKKPTISFETSKTAEDLKVCIEEGWIEHWNTTKSAKVSTGYIITLPNGFNDPIAMAHVKQKETGSSVQFFESGWWISREAISNTLIGCK